MLPFKTRRSAGVPVAPAVHRVIARGNAARDRRDWAGAAACFRQALAMDDGLAHIAVQLGNMERELGRRAQARTAFQAAIRLRPGSTDALMELGRLAEDEGDHVQAGECFQRAYVADPGLRDAARGVERVLARAHGRTRDRLLAALRALLADDLPDAPTAVPDGGGAHGPATVFDLSDLVRYWGYGRAPTGIQRVQIQLVTHALARHDAPAALCCFVDGRADWLGVDPGLFAQVVALSLDGGSRDDPAWTAALHRLHLHLTLAGPFAFPRGSVLVSLGGPWPLYNHFLFVRAAKARYGVRYVPFVHDVISVVAPEFFTKAARREVVPWLAGVFAHADQVLVNSNATKRDLLRLGAGMDRRLDDGDVTVIPLDADPRTPGIPALGDGALAQWGLAGEPFVLLVSTVEGRKGHATAFDAWAALIARRGPAAVPRLVCVGRRGWLSDGVYGRLDADPVLASRVSMLQEVGDAGLALLYKSCLFTLYPSLYEGWGLPVTESLCHGKPVIASNTSSLPEAGGAYAVYVEPGSAPALAAAAERMIFDAPYREGVAARIRAGFRPRRWDDLAAQVGTALARLAARDEAHGPVLSRPVARLGAYHPVGRPAALRLFPGAGAGEAFRAGTGWTPPDPAGSWTRPEGGLLEIGLPPGAGAVRVGLLLLGAPECDVDWRVEVRDGPVLAGTLDRGGRRWATFTHAAAAGNGGALVLRLRAEPSDGAGEDGPAVRVGLAGFLVHAEGDAAARARLLEAVAMGTLDEVDAFREPGPPPLTATDGDWT